MSSRLRSSSVGCRPRPRLHRSSRAESAAALALDVRCACQYYETNSLLPERVNPVGYNAAQEFEPCIHIHARMIELQQQQQQQQREEEEQQSFLPTITPNQQQTNMVVTQPHSKVYEIPPEFAPENQYIDNLMVNKCTDIDENARSVSCANIGNTRSSTPQFMKQRDPSTSSLLRKRMSEDRRGSTNSRDRFISQRDPSESAILRRKMSNQSSGSFDQASNEMMSTERIHQPYQFHTSRIPNERTFYRDSNELARAANVDVGDATESPLQQQSSATQTAVEMATPLSMQAQGNRRFVLSSKENIPHQQIDAYMKTSVETEPDSGIDSNYVDEPQPRNRNVSDEEKVQILLSKSNNLNAENTNPAKQHQNLQLMNKEDVEMEMPVRKQLQYQYIARTDNTLRPQEAQTSEYSYSKIFDNYKSSQSSLAQGSNISTPDLRMNYAKQRDPSQSPFIQNRYKTKMHDTTTECMNNPISMEMKATMHDKLLPSAGELPERRASDVFCAPPPKPDAGPAYIRQKDLRTSNVLNRRRRNLSQTSLGHDIEMAASIGQPTKVTKTISFEKNLSNNNDSDQISPFTGAGITITKGVSFEYDKPMTTDRSEQNAFDASQLSANKRPFR